MSVVTMELKGASKVRASEIQYSSIASYTTKYEYPNPDCEHWFCGCL